MNALKNLLQAIGFTQKVEEDLDYNDEIRENAADEVNHSSSSQPSNNAHTASNNRPERHTPLQPNKRKNPPVEISSEEVGGLTAHIFDSVIKIFNESLPDFLSASVDPEAQRKYLYDSLENSVKEQFAQITESARKSTERQWTSERDNLRTEIESIRSKCKIAETKQNEYQQQKLSAERQKRALSERVKDLETKIMTLEADKEQLDLQIKSLVNRIKASEVRDGDVKSLTDQIADLELQLAESRKATIEARNKAVDNESDALKAAIAEKETQIAELKAEVEGKQAEIDAIKAIEPSDEVKQVKEKNRIADAMINDLNAKLAQAKNDISEKNRIIDRLTNDGKREKAEAEIARERLRIAGDKGQVVERLNEKIKEQTGIIEKLTRQVDSMKKKVAEQEQSLEIVDKIQKKVESFDKIKSESDAKIKSLKAERDQLKATIETNLYNQANNEKRLRQQIADLEDKLKKADKQKHEEKKERQRPDIAISAIDSSLDDTDWLVSTPDPNATLRNEANDDFGYQEPERNSNDDDQQPSLF